MWPEADLRHAPVADWPPRWAAAWGDDEFGLWADLRIGVQAQQRFRWIEPGSFTMGSPETEKPRYDDEGPAHHVTLTRGFWFADTPCTQAFWLAVMGGENPSRFKDEPDSPQRPVEQVTWDDAMGFVERLQQRLQGRAEPGLPTEAQWEYACRAGAQTAYFWGDKFDAQRANVRTDGTTPIKRYSPNPWGLFDMHGNVWEWCADWLGTYRDRPEVDPQGSPVGDARAARGGSWGDEPALARSASRHDRHRGFRWPDQGFRLALRSLGPGGPAVAGSRPDGGRPRRRAERAGGG
jgi:formylglycine-generating enzyme